MNRQGEVKSKCYVCGEISDPNQRNGKVWTAGWSLRDGMEGYELKVNGSLFNQAYRHNCCWDRYGIKSDSPFPLARAGLRFRRTEAYADLIHMHPPPVHYLKGLLLNFLYCMGFDHGTKETNLLSCVSTGAKKPQEIIRWG